MFWFCCTEIYFYSWKANLKYRFWWCYLDHLRTFWVDQDYFDNQCHRSYNLDEVFYRNQNFGTTYIYIYEWIANYCYDWRETMKVNLYNFLVVYFITSYARSTQQKFPNTSSIISRDMPHINVRFILRVDDSMRRQ